jgi:hypothetical protein
MPHNLIFLGLHFVICKREPISILHTHSANRVSAVYGNSLLATLVRSEKKDMAAPLTFFTCLAASTSASSYNEHLKSVLRIIPPSSCSAVTGVPSP